MTKFLQQMIGGIPGAEGDKGRAGDDLDTLPPGLAALLGSRPPGVGFSPDSGSSASSGESVNEVSWKILHALSAVMLATYMAILTPFSGSQSPKATRASKDGMGDYDQRLFWIFATAELLLQSGRFFLEGGKGEQSGWMGTVARMLPKPWSGYAALLSRYSRIWTTIVEDAMVVVFVLGCVAWWNGAVG